MKNSRLAAAFALLAVAVSVSEISSADVGAMKALVAVDPTISFQKVTCYKTSGKKGNSLLGGDGVIHGGTPGPFVAGKTAVEYTVFGFYKFLVDDNGSAADYKIIQDAIDAANDGDTIYVCPGTYREMISISKDVKLIGVAGAKETTIDSSTLGDGTVVSVGANATVQGFKITGAHHDALCFYGGGIKIAGTTDEPEGSVEIRTPIIQQNIITGNDACQGGDGIHITGGGRSGYGRAYNQAVIRNNVIFTNSQGFGVWLDCSQANGSTIQNNVIVDHNAGIYVDDNESCDATSKIVNNAIYDTIRPFITYTVDGSTASVSYVFNATLEYNDYYLYTATDFDASGISATNLNVDPVFTGTTEYRLDAASPLVNAGDPAASYNDTDGTRNDIGAYGGKQGRW